MGKIKKIKSHGDTVLSSGPLGEQIVSDKHASKKRKQKTKHQDGGQANETDKNFVEESLSKKILDEALKQQKELLQNEDIDDREDISQGTEKWRLNDPTPSSSLGRQSVSEDEYNSGEEDYFNPVEVDPAEEEALEKFMSSDVGKRQTLADIIQQKITDKQSEVATQFSDVSLQLRQLDPRLMEMYKGVGEVLSTYRSGKLPKAFKIIPKLVNWEQILELTQPERWTAAAMYQGIKSIRDDIAEYKKLNFHLYQALQKGLFKPAAFFKGFLLPLCEDDVIFKRTPREATIVSSVLTKCSVPVLHAAAALLKIAEMDYTGANSVFLRTLIDKKYTMPFRVIDALVAHFVRFQCDKREMPVLWHQTMLSLVQRYKSDMSSEQRESLLDVIKVHNHYMIRHYSKNK